MVWKFPSDWKYHAYSGCTRINSYQIGYKGNSSIVINCRNRVTENCLNSISCFFNGELSKEKEHKTLQLWVRTPPKLTLTITVVVITTLQENWLLPQTAPFCLHLLHCQHHFNLLSKCQSISTLVHRCSLPLLKLL